MWGCLNDFLFIYFFNVRGGYVLFIYDSGDTYGWMAFHFLLANFFSIQPNVSESRIGLNGPKKKLLSHHLCFCGFQRMPKITCAVGCDIVFTNTLTNTIFFK